MTIEEALQELEYAPADIEEAKSFSDKEQYVTAVGILTGVSRTLESVARAFPELDDKVAPMVKDATALTMTIIRKAQR